MSPRPIEWIRCISTPFSTRKRRTASERRWLSCTLYGSAAGVVGVALELDHEVRVVLELLHDVEQRGLTAIVELRLVEAEKDRDRVARHALVAVRSRAGSGACWSRPPSPSPGRRPHELRPLESGPGSPWRRPRPRGPGRSWRGWSPRWRVLSACWTATFVWPSWSLSAVVRAFSSVRAESTRPDIRADLRLALSDFLADELLRRAPDGHERKGSHYNGQCTYPHTSSSSVRGHPAR